MVDTIHCPRRLLWQSSAACVEDWKRAQAKRPMPWESRWHCRGCVDGSMRAGRGTTAAERVQMLDGVRGICIRCHRPTPRIVQNRFCISCYNRNRELLAGRNGKGGFPSVLSARYHLHTLPVIYRALSKSLWEWRRPVEMVCDPVEALLWLLRQSGQPLLVGRGTPAMGRQLSFWGGV